MTTLKENWFKKHTIQNLANSEYILLTFVLIPGRSWVSLGSLWFMSKENNEEKMIAFRSFFFSLLHLLYVLVPLKSYISRKYTENVTKRKYFFMSYNFIVSMNRKGIRLVTPGKSVFNKYVREKNYLSCQQFRTTFQFVFITFFF